MSGRRGGHAIHRVGEVLDKFVEPIQRNQAKGSYRSLRVIEEQRAEIRALRDETARLKGLPPRLTIRPSTLHAPHPDPQHKKRRRGKRPGSSKRPKTDELLIHETIPVPLEELPEGTQQNGYEDFVVQDLTIEAHNVC